MMLNSQYALYPPQPDNPTDEERHVLLKYALSELGWAQDMPQILAQLSPPRPVTDIAPPGSLKGVRVGVLGGGLAGLSAAYELRKTGCDVAVFDALEDRVGGRVYTYYFSQTPGGYGDFGAMRIPVSHETVWHYIKLFGLPTSTFMQANPNGFAYLKKTRVRNDADGANVMSAIYPKYELTPKERRTNWQTLLNIGVNSPLLRATTADRLQTIQVRAQYTSRALEWINNPSISIMERSGLSQGAISLVPNFVPLLSGNLYNSYIDYIQENYPASPSYLYTIPGGLSNLPAAFYQSFFSTSPYAGISADALGSVSYYPGHFVSGILLSDDGESVTLQHTANGSSNSAYSSYDYVVCAIPFSTLRMLQVAPLFSSLKMRAIREVNYTPSQKTLIYFRQRFWEKQGIIGGPSYTDLPLSSIWYTNDHVGLLANGYNSQNALNTNEPGVIIGSYNFGLDTTRLVNQPEPELLTEFIRELSEVHGLPEEELRRDVIGFKAVNWNQELTFRGALSFYSAQQKRLFSYAMTTPEYDNRVFFAGEHVSALHRWMQGALQSGMIAANDLTRAASQRQKR